MHELASDLAGYGHQVTVITTFPPRHVLAEYGDEAAALTRRFFARERMNGFRVVRVRTLPFAKLPPAVRAATQLTLAAGLLGGGLAAGEHDVVFAYSPPLELGLVCDILKRLSGARFILNVQDIYPQALVDLGLVRNRLAIRLMERLERYLYGRADAISVHSNGNRDLLVRRGTPAQKVHVVPNWIDTDALQPRPRENAFRRRHGLDGKFVVLFAGVMGYAQDLECVIDAAALVRHTPDITFLLVGDGAARPAIVKKAQTLGLRSVDFLPFQPLDTYPLVVAAADVCLVTLQARVATPVVPSKILGMMAASRPMVASVPLGGDAARLVREARCGICVNPGDASAIAAAVLQLFDDAALREELGRNGRCYAEEFLSRKAVTHLYHEMIADLAGAPP